MAELEAAVLMRPPLLIAENDCWRKVAFSWRSKAIAPDSRPSYDSTSAAGTGAELNTSHPLTATHIEMDFMKKLVFLLAMGWLLPGCAAAPSHPVPDGLWYAEKEVPDRFDYQVYVLFQDDSHFIWWRTLDAQDVVLKRLEHYTRDNGTPSAPALYTRIGDELKGESRTVVNNKKGVALYTFIQNFNGRFEDETLDMELQRSTLWPDGPPRTEERVRWSMKRLKSQLAK